MDLLAHIPEGLWQSRADWLGAVGEKWSNPRASYLSSEQATLLTYDLHRAYCAGAWISVLVLCHAAIDATIRDTETGDYRSNSKKLFGGDPDLEWLRKKRNRLVHVSEESKESLGDFDVYHEALEADAQRAIELLFRTIYASPGT